MGVGVHTPYVNQEETGLDSFTDPSNGTHRPADAVAAANPARSRAETAPYDADEIADQSLDSDADRDDLSYVCASCDATIDARQWHPVVARSNGAPTVFLFCGASCRRKWLGQEAIDE